MTDGEGRVRHERSGGDIAVTGSAGPLGAALVNRLRDTGQAGVVEVGGVSPKLARDLGGVDTVVHLEVDRSLDNPAETRRATNVAGTALTLDAAASAGVRRVVLLTSAMVYGARRDNAVPLNEDGPLADDVPTGLVSDWIAMERLAEAHSVTSGGRLEVVPVRPASLVGLAADPLLPGLFESVRLLALRDGNCLWQFCHHDDLLDALGAAATGAVSGPVTVGSEGWLDQAEVERIAGMRSVVLRPSVAYATAERLHRVGALSAPAGELAYLQHPWVVGSQRLRASGWAPRWTNQAALEDHLQRLGDRVGRSLVVDRKYATRAAAGAGATLAVIGSLALARSRARRR